MIRRKANQADADPDAGFSFEHWVQFFLVPTLGNIFIELSLHSITRQKSHCIQLLCYHALRYALNLAFFKS